jgi:hypothetical protein
VEAAALAATGPIAAAAISAPVASLCEGVIKTMLVAKIKAIALAVGTTAAFVSGAVVLAQPGQPGSNDPAAGTKGSTRSDPDGQAALEKKLDRVLEALERISGTGNARLDGRPGAALNSISAAANRLAVPAPSVALSRLLGERYATKEDAPDPVPLSDRVQAIEQQIQEILQRLGQVEEQLKSLDARIGGVRGVRGVLRRTEEAKKP